MCDLGPAIADYRYLRERGYSPGCSQAGRRPPRAHGQGAEPPVQGSPAGRCGLRAGREGFLRPQTWPAGRLGIDWYNVLITVESYLKGCEVFLADDGVIRDAAAVHGSYQGRGRDRPGHEADPRSPERPRARHGRCVRRFAGGLLGTRWRSSLREGLGGALFAAHVEVVESPDYFLKSYAGVVASSDSAIIDRAPTVFDLPRCTLRESVPIRAARAVGIQAGPRGSLSLLRTPGLRPRTCLRIRRLGKSERTKPSSQPCCLRRRLRCAPPRGRPGRSRAARQSSSTSSVTTRAPTSSATSLATPRSRSPATRRRAALGMTLHAKPDPVLGEPRVVEVAELRPRGRGPRRSPPRRSRRCTSLRRSPCRE